MSWRGMFCGERWDGGRLVTPLPAGTRFWRVCAQPLCCQACQNLTRVESELRSEPRSHVMALDRVCPSTAPGLNHKLSAKRVGDPSGGNGRVAKSALGNLEYWYEPFRGAPRSSAAIDVAAALSGLR